MHRTESSNVLIIGSGAAGWRAAIAATEAGVEVRILAKRPRMDAHTVLASGGINAALGTRDPQDSPEQHVADTMREGYFLGDPRMVEILARESPQPSFRSGRGSSRLRTPPLGIGAVHQQRPTYDPTHRSHQ